MADQPTSDHPEEDELDLESFLVEHPREDSGDTNESTVDLDLAAAPTGDGAYVNSGTDATAATEKETQSSESAELDFEIELPPLDMSDSSGSSATSQSSTVSTAAASEEGSADTDMPVGSGSQPGPTPETDDGPEDNVGVPTQNEGSDPSADEADPDSDEDGDESEDTGPGRRRRRRRKRDPFAGWGKVQSAEASTRARQLTSLSEMKRIKRARVRHEGQRVVTDDVKKLKSLAIEPRLPPGEYMNYYVEPVRIEYYIPRESRFAVETRYLYIPLIDPVARERDQILKLHMEEDRFVDLIEIMNEYPVHITDILDSYSETMNMYESISRTYDDAQSGNVEQLRSVFYQCEILMDFEPTLAALKFLGDFQSWNLNWLIRRLNALGVDLAASDKTVSLLIKKRNMHWEEQGLDYDERFEILAALFYEQAFPNRGLEYDQEDYFFDIFDTRKKF